MAGRGTGVPNWFRCAMARREYGLESGLGRSPHFVTLTGRTRPTKKGNGHPRKSWTTFEYRCKCGHVGWSSHVDLEHLANRST